MPWEAAASPSSLWVDGGQLLLLQLVCCGGSSRSSAQLDCTQVLMEKAGVGGFLS